MKKLTVKCPHCQSELIIDAESGIVIESIKPEKKLSFDEILSKEKNKSKELEEKFSQAFQQEKKKKEYLEEKFKESLSEAKKNPEKPESIFDWD